jgi:hypothetical protein
MGQPRIVGVAHRGRAKGPAGVLAQLLPLPIRDVEGRVGEDEVEALIREGVAFQRAFLIPLDVGEDASDRQVHAREAVGGVVPLLPIDRDGVDAALMVADELLGLDEEAAGAAAGVVNAALGRLQHRHQRLDHRFGGVEFAAALAFGGGEFPDAVFVDAPDQVEVGLGAVERHVGEEVDQAGDDAAVEAFAPEDLGQRVLEGGVGFLDLAHGAVDLHPDLRGFGDGGDAGPAGGLGHPEDVLGEVFLGIFGVGVVLGFKLDALQIERSGDVAQEEKAEGDMLVFASVHGAAHLVGGGEQGFLDGQGRLQLGSAQGRSRDMNTSWWGCHGESCKLFSHAILAKRR